MYELLKVFQQFLPDSNTVVIILTISILSSRRGDELSPKSAFHADQYTKPHTPHRKGPTVIEE